MHKSSMAVGLVSSRWGGGISHLLEVELGGCSSLVSLTGEQRRRHHLYSAGLGWMHGDLQQSKVVALPCTPSQQQQKGIWIVERKLMACLG